MHVCTRLCMLYVYVRRCICTCICVWIYICMCLCMYACMYYVYVYVWLFECIYVCVYISMYLWGWMEEHHSLSTWFVNSSFYNSNAYIFMMYKDCVSIKVHKAIQLLYYCIYVWCRVYVHWHWGYMCTHICFSFILESNLSQLVSDMRSFHWECVLAEAKLWSMCIS